jgi:succinate dehydrogenase hydrophobic anchor subunit
MSFGGSVFAMIQSLRANARPKHHAYQSWEKSDRLIFKNKYKLVSKQVSPEKLKQVKAKYKKEIEKEQKRYLTITIATIVILIPLVTFAIFQFFFSNSQKNYHPYVSQKDKQVTTHNCPKVFTKRLFSILMHSISGVILKITPKKAV